MADEELDMQDDNLEEDEEMEGADDSDVTGDRDGEAEAETESVEDLVAAAASASLAARNKVRESMQAEIEAFLARGGKIQTIDDNVMADPPRKPTSSYGSRPI
ncbi:hypothetical protein GJQ54_12930 [Oceanospirillaceae bacterium ASx5O]|nr:hypothetical protein GJQ54_12930 [Oceanospirillaceae bacterium ASx5O]